MVALKVTHVGVGVREEKGDIVPLFWTLTVGVEEGVRVPPPPPPPPGEVVMVALPVGVGAQGETVRVPPLVGVEKGEKDGVEREEVERRGDAVGVKLGREEVENVEDGVDWVECEGAIFVRVGVGLSVPCVKGESVPFALVEACGEPLQEPLCVGKSGEAVGENDTGAVALG